MNENIGEKRKRANFQSDFVTTFVTHKCFLKQIFTLQGNVQLKNMQRLMDQLLVVSLLIMVNFLILISHMFLITFFNKLDF